MNTLDIKKAIKKGMVFTCLCDECQRTLGPDVWLNIVNIDQKIGKATVHFKALRILCPNCVAMEMGP